MRKLSDLAEITKLASELGCKMVKLKKSFRINPEGKPDAISTGHTMYYISICSLFHSFTKYLLSNLLCARPFSQYSESNCEQDAQNLLEI